MRIKIAEIYQVGDADCYDANPPLAYDVVRVCNKFNKFLAMNATIAATPKFDYSAFIADGVIKGPRLNSVYCLDDCLIENELGSACAGVLHLVSVAGAVDSVDDLCCVFLRELKSLAHYRGYDKIAHKEYSINDNFKLSSFNSVRKLEKFLRGGQNVKSN